jgi:CHAT domain-containing protein
LTLDLLGWSLFEEGEYAEAERNFREVAHIYETARSHTEMGSNRSLKYRLTVYDEIAATLLETGRSAEAWPLLERGLSPTLAEYLDAGAERDRVFSLDRIQRCIPEGTALIGWLDVSHLNQPPARTWGYVIRKQGAVRWVRLATGRNVYERVVAFCSRMVLDRTWPARLAPTQEIDRRAHEVWADRMAGFSPYLQGIERLIVVYSFRMADVPVEALRDASGSYVGDHYAVAYAPSASVYARLEERARKHRRDPVRPRRALVVGDPPLSAEWREGRRSQELGSTDRPTTGDLAQVAPSASATPPVDATIQRGAPSGERTPLENLRPLPRARWEASRIADLLPGATVLLGPAASERRIHQLSASGELRRFDTIHLATHAILDAKLPDGSALVLSQVEGIAPSVASLRDSRIDGLLTPREICRLRLDADLVTLSGCTTGGYNVQGEACIGPGEAFLRAGTRSLIVSRWRVDDRATSLLMARLYENLTARDATGRNLSKVEALRRAKQWLRDYTDPDGRRPYAHCAYWSAFELIGDPE